MANTTAGSSYPDADRRRGRLSDTEAEAVEEQHEEESVQSASSLSAKLVYEVIKREGDEELARPAASLIWSGLAAGILISFSVIGEAGFHAHLPDTDWRPLVENLGYSLGFILVIVGRMQLFTENTITTVMPLVSRRSRECAVAMARLWTIVILSNLVGAFIAAGFIHLTPAFTPEMKEAILYVSEHAMEPNAWQQLWKAMPAGMLIAALVWMMPVSRGENIVVIVIFTWMIAAGEFAHVVAGSVEMAYLMMEGTMNVFDGVFTFFFPAFVGNVIGGTVIFTLLAYAQVRNEVDDTA